MQILIGWEDNYQTWKIEVPVDSPLQMRRKIKVPSMVLLDASCSRITKVPGALLHSVYVSMIIYIYLSSRQIEHVLLTTSSSLKQHYLKHCKKKKKKLENQKCFVAFKQQKTLVHNKHMSLHCQSQSVAKLNSKQISFLYLIPFSLSPSFCLPLSNIWLSSFLHHHSCLSSLALNLLHPSSILA